MLLQVDSLIQTHKVASVVASLTRSGDVIVLAGEMGAGKTAFAQGFGRELGISDPITSPTFTLVHSYPYGDRHTLHHADLYRLDSMADVEELALHELAEFGGVVLIEWGDVAAGALGAHLEIRLEVRDDDEVGEAAESESGHEDRAVPDFVVDERRLIELSATGPMWAGRWDRLASALSEYRA